MGESQETTRSFQKEITKARKEGNTNRVNKLITLVFLIIFIWPIFMWLRAFLGDLPHYYFTLPWANSISFFYKPFLMQSWLWLYLIFSMIFGQLIRQGLKIVSWSKWWRETKAKIKIS